MLVLEVAMPSDPEYLVRIETFDTFLGPLGYAPGTAFEFDGKLSFAKPAAINCALRGKHSAEQRAFVEL